MRYITAIAALLISFSCIIAAPIPSTPDSIPFDEEDPYFLLTEEADRAIARGDYEEAAARLIDAIAVKPESPSNALLMSNLGMMYSCLGRDSLALATIDAALERAPGLRTAISNRAHVLLKLGRDNEAYQNFSQIIEKDSLDIDARYYHGMIALYSGKLETATADFKVLTDTNPDSFDTAVAMSAFHSLTGNDREAIPYFEKLIAYESAPEYYAGLAGCLLSLGELSRAGAVIADGLKLFPNDSELYYYRAWLNRDRFRLDDAHADGRKAVSLGASPQRVEALFKNR